MSTRTVFAAAIAALVTAFTLPVGAQESADAKFLADAIRSDIAEVRLAQLAEQRGYSEEVRKFGRMLSADHGTSRGKTADLAKSLKVAAPTQPSADAEKKYEKLATLSGEAFDRAFVDAMIAGHEEAIAKFKKEAESAGDSEIRLLATETLPTLEQHLMTARSLNNGEAHHPGA
jgi:putative membrane protein